MQQVKSVKTLSMTVIVASQVAGMSLWFSASAAAPALIAQGIIEPARASLLTSAVQLGFVAGTFTSAFFGLADRFDSRRLFASAAVFGSAANLLLLVSGLQSDATIALRFITGMAMAGVYPVGMKLAAGWADKNMGLMIGLLVGAVTLGSSLPHLFAIFGSVDWRVPIACSSVFALLAAAMIMTLQLGPRHVQGARFNLAAARTALFKRSLALVNLGYLGHMWELYAMWAWLGAFMVWAQSQHATANNLSWFNPPAITFAVIASGAAGCIFAGAVADRYGRTATTITAMLVSGSCALLIGMAAEFSLPLMVMLALVWGVAIVADSAQFSASVVELSEPHLSGTALTIQTCLGFLLTFFVIQLMPLAVDLLTWRYAFAVLAIGPAIGAASMYRLRLLPEAERLAGGLR